MKGNKVCVVTVTYGDRARYLSQLIEVCLGLESVSNIVVVDNCSSCGDGFFTSFKNDKIHHVYLDSNTGSANGYKVGIQYALSQFDCEFVWLLDDDNVPKYNALDKLLDSYNEIYLKKNAHNFAVQSRRPGFIAHSSIFSNSDYYKLYKDYNRFLGFSFYNLSVKVSGLLFRPKVNNLECADGIYPVDYTEYGGTLLNINLIKDIGLPNDEYFLYSDDAEYTARITKSDGEIFILKDSVVDDVDFSWNSQGGSKSFLPILDDSSEFRVYYSTRNQLYFQKNFRVKSKFSFFVNGFIYIFILTAAALFKFRLNRLVTIYDSIRDGLTGNLGENKKYALVRK